LKVILKEYQENLGDVGDLVEVKAGYANNYLIPQGIALLATKGNIEQMKLVKKAVLKVEAKNIEDANKVAESLAGLTLNFVVKTGEEGKLYGSITNKDLAQKIVEEKNIEIDRKKIDLPEHIKELGEYDVDIKLYKEIKAPVKVIVEPDEESKALIEAHKKEKEEALAEEKGKIDAEIEAEAEKEGEKKEDEQADAGEKPEKSEAKEEDKSRKKSKEKGKD
jgi:large subunit ribosomal protein L9